MSGLRPGDTVSSDQAFTAWARLFYDSARAATFTWEARAAR
ncbi:hypothetical protein [Calidifontibacter indicus]